MEINKPVSITIILIITLTVFFLFVVPKYQEVSTLEMELNKKQAQYEGRVDYYLKLSDILKTIEKKQDVLTKIDSALPSEFILAPIISFFQEKSAESGLAIKSVNFSQQESFKLVLNENLSGQVKNIIFRVEVQGSYESLKKFLSSLEKSARLFEVNSISFTSSPQSSSKKQSASRIYDFTLEIETYTY